MPDVIDRYFTTDDQAACFTADAVVHDDGGTHRGIEEIRAWRQGVAATFEHTVTVLSRDDDARGVRVATEVSGTFPGSPVRLTHVFVLDAGGLIRELTIS